MRLRVVHRTSYQYESLATTSHHDARLTPRQGESQHTVSHEIEIVPAPAARRARLDYFGNRTTYFGLTEPHRQLEVTATSLIETAEHELPEFGLAPAWEYVGDRLRCDLQSDVLQAAQMRFASPLVPLLVDARDYAVRSFERQKPIFLAVEDLMQRIHRDFAYDPCATDLSTPLAEVMQSRRGVCQDLAHIMLSCLRSLGLAARYVSGYLRTRPPPGQPRRVGVDASHAWVSVWAPERGWVDFDPTNAVCPSVEHVTLAFGRDFSDVTPLRGVMRGGGKHVLTVAVDVDETD